MLELGAGTGLVAIALALEGAQVCATDGNPKVCEGGPGSHPASDLVGAAASFSGGGSPGVLGNSGSSGASQDFGFTDLA